MAEDERQREMGRMASASEKQLRSAAMRGLRAIMMRLAKGETAMLIEIWRTNLRWGSMQAADALRQSLEAEMRAGQLSAALKQLQMVIAGMIRGAKGMALQSMRSTMAEDERQRQMRHCKLSMAFEQWQVRTDD